MKITTEFGCLMFEGKHFVFHTINNWAQFMRPGTWNWIDFQFILAEFELDRILPGWEISVAILGLGFRFRWNYDWSKSETASKILEQVNEAKEKYVSRGIESGKEEGFSEESSR